MRERKPINIRVGANIQRLREEAHMTQEELSEAVGVTPNHLSAVERGVSGPSLELIERLCGALHVTSDHIIFGQPNIGMERDDFLRIIRAAGREQQALLESIKDLTDAVKEFKNGMK